MSKTLAEQAVAERKRRGLTQRELAQSAGISHRAYQDFEAGKTKPQRDTLRKIVEALDLQMEGAEVAQMTREARPRETQVFLEMLGAYLDTMTPEQRMAFIHDETRKIFNGR